MIVFALVIVVNTTIGSLRRSARTGPSPPWSAAISYGLHTDDVVPADPTLTSAHRLQLDESALTGESLPVAHAASSEATPARSW